MRFALLTLLVLLPTTASAEGPEWYVLPVYAEHPPPQDPTLLRLSKTIGAAIADQTNADVRLVSRELRTEHCRDDGHRCPDAIARILDVDRVIALDLSPDFDVLVAWIHDPPSRTSKIVVKCSWDGGPVCDVDALAAKLADNRRPEFDPTNVDAAFDALAPRIAACFEARKEKPDPDASVTFRLRSDGRPIEVRVDPKAMQRRRAYRCAARVVESLRVPPFEADRMPFLRKPLVAE